MKYKNYTVGENVLDFLVGEILVVELKAVDSLTSLHSAQVISYMKVTGCQLGLLIHFNVPILKEGIRRAASSLFNSSQALRVGFANALFASSWFINLKSDRACTPTSQHFSYFSLIVVDVTKMILNLSKMQTK